MIRVAESSVLNSSLGTPCGDLADFGRLAQTSSPALRPKSAKNSTTSTAIRRICEQSEAINTRICDLDSANPQNLGGNLNQKPIKSFCSVWLSTKVESPLPLNPNLPNNVDSANPQNLGGKSLSLRDSAKQNRGKPSIKKTAESQSGLPRSPSLARNDDSFLDSAILQNQFFPTKIKDSTHFAESSKKFLPNTALIALGANLKNPIRTFKMLFLKLKRNAKIHILATSPIYKNPPFGFRAQPSFYNATMMLATKMCLLEFYAFMFYLERIFGRGRIRAFKNAPRALDIDIIFFNDIFMRSAKLNIPHPHWRTRPSVVVPLLFQVNYKGF